MKKTYCDMCGIELDLIYSVTLSDWQDDDIVSAEYELCEKHFDDVYKLITSDKGERKTDKRFG